MTRVRLAAGVLVAGLALFIFPHAPACAEELMILTVGGNLYALEVPATTAAPTKLLSGLEKVRLFERVGRMIVTLSEDGRLEQFEPSGAARRSVGSTPYRDVRFLVEVCGRLVLAGENIVVVDPASGEHRIICPARDLRIVTSCGGALLALSADNALVRIDLGSGARKVLFSDPRLGKIGVLAALEDRLFGVDRHGVLLELTPGGGTFRRVLGPTTGLSYCELLAGRAGALWMVTHWGNLYRIDPDRGTADLLSHDWINACSIR